MKLKYLVNCKDKMLFANCLQDLASHYNVTVSGIKYKIKHNLIAITKIDIQLQDLNFEYAINKYGVVTAIKTDIFKQFDNQKIDSITDIKTDS